MKTQAGFFSIITLLLITVILSTPLSFRINKNNTAPYPKPKIAKTRPTVTPTITPSPTEFEKLDIEPTPTPTTTPTEEPAIGGPSEESEDSDTTPPDTHIISGPNNSQRSTQDTTPPKTNVFFPSDGGEMPYKTDDKYCAVANGPEDDVTSYNDIETQFAFDNEPWSEYGKIRAFMCTDHLTKGEHTLRFRSKDQAGNIEEERTIRFTVTFE